MLVLCFSIIRCQKESSTSPNDNVLNELPIDKYYRSEIFNVKNMSLYGSWQPISSSGGLTGTGYKLDFDYMIIKPYGIFGLVRHDSLVAYGGINIISQTDTQLTVDFVSDVDPEKAGINLVQETEKNIVLHNDTLDLNAYCCDRYNTRLKRLK